MIFEVHTRAFINIRVAAFVEAAVYHAAHANGYY